MTKVHTGSCFCGAVKLEVRGEPRLTDFCHCVDCRGWHGAPINAFSIWSPGQVTITEGEDLVASFAKTSHTIRKRCSKCGGALMNDHPEKGFVDIFAPVLRDFDHRPSLHVYYAERMVDMRDGLPKFRGLPGPDRTKGDMPE